MINVANLITVLRVVLALFTLALLFVPANQSQDLFYWIAFVLTVIVIWADGLDGYFARKLNQTSKFGAILDIAGDRVVEMAYWITFSALGWIPVWIPLLFLVRGTFVDAMRSHASEKGYTAFGAKTMMQSKVGKFLVASNFPGSHMLWSRPWPSAWLLRPTPDCSPEQAPKLQLTFSSISQPPSASSEVCL